ncbi:MAG: biotin/lipoyl-binding protein, partial [Bdellovibrionota bacterium]
MKKFKATAAKLIEDIFGDRSTPMFWSWLGAIVVIFAVGGYVGSENVAFLGIAESREININFERAVEIKTIHVQTGQRVSKGDILLELNQSEIETNLRALQAQLGRINAELKLRESLSRIVSKKKVVSNVVDPLTVERAQVTKEIGLLENQKRNLFVFAEIDGIVGAVNFKKGEKVPSFTSIVTLSPENPSYVQGFVHEDRYDGRLRIIRA